jgi:preprotein translocase subunit SecG
MQRSEGGGLGVGGSSSGVMAAIAGATREPTKIDTSLAGKAAPVQRSKPAQSPVQPATNPAQKQPKQEAPAVPLAQ